MIFAIDVGNTTMTLGLMNSEEPLRQWRLLSGKCTSDEIGMRLCTLLNLTGFEKSDVTGAALSSVVPGLDELFEEAFRNYFDVDCLNVKGTMDLGITVDLDRPSEVGADRVVNAVAAIRRWGAPAIVADFGTAITLDVIASENRYVGGTISPGLVTSVEALFGRTSKLPKIALSAGPSVIGRNTADCICSGVIRGTAAMIDGLVDQIQQELGYRCTVAATGGHAATVASVSRAIEHVDPWLTLRGLWHIYQRFQGVRV